MSYQFHPQLERLETRAVPAAHSAWQDAERLTVSLAHDGVDILGSTNRLFETLRQFPQQIWQTEVLRSLQAWAAASNINFALVDDAGLPFGTAGLPQGDPRFGDIRIGALPQSEDALAVASPADLFSGTWGGDILLNSDVAFSIDGGDGPDLFSVFLHEIGHVLGLEHNDDAESVMQSQLHPVTALSASDIARIQQIYGERQPDSYEGSDGNEELDTATILTPVNGKFTARGDITSHGDADVYTFRINGNTDRVTISLQTQAFSLLLPRLTVYDADGAVLAVLDRPDHFMDDLQLEFNTQGADRFYVKVEAGDEVFSVGSYQLEVTAVTNKPESPGPNNDPKEPSGSPLDRATFINPYTGNPQSFSFKETGILQAGATAIYRFKIPNAQQLGDAQTLLLTVRRTGAADWQPEVTILNRAGEPVAFETLIRGDGMVTLQLRELDFNHDYFVQIDSADLSAADGSFFLGIDFNEEAVELETFAAGVTDDSGAGSGLLTVERNRLVHLLLSTDAAHTGFARLTLSDSNGNLVSQMLVPLGAHASASVFLPQGSYALHVQTLDENGAPISGVAYTVKGKQLTDPVGPELQDLLVDAVFPRPGPSIPPDQTTGAGNSGQQGSKTPAAEVATGSPGAGSSSNAGTGDSTGASTPARSATAALARTADVNAADGNASDLAVVPATAVVVTPSNVASVNIARSAPPAAAVSGGAQNAAGNTAIVAAPADELPEDVAEVDSDPPEPEVQEPVKTAADVVVQAPTGQQTAAAEAADEGTNGPASVVQSVTHFPLAIVLITLASTAGWLLGTLMPRQRSPHQEPQLRSPNSDIDNGAR